MRGDSIILFEIPIYSMDEESYRAKWENKIERLYNESYSNLFNETSRFGKHGRRICESFRKQMDWKYRQIVAYIIVDVWEDSKTIGFNIYGDLTYEVGKREGERRGFRYDRPTLPNMPIACSPSCDHFPYGFLEEPCNEKIRQSIKSRIKEKVKFYAKKPLYADTSLFDATIDCIDILKYIEIRRKQHGEDCTR